MTPLGLLNFLVLQWFGVRLVRRMITKLVNPRDHHVAITGGVFSWGSTCDAISVPDGWRLVRWVWPLTGWWSDYRWIARRP